MGTKIQLSIPHHHPSHLDLCRDDLQYQHRYKKFKCDHVILEHGDVFLTINFMKCNEYKVYFPQVVVVMTLTTKRLKTVHKRCNMELLVFESVRKRA